MECQKLLKVEPGLQEEKMGHTLRGPMEDNPIVYFRCRVIEKDGNCRISSTDELDG